MLLIAKLMVLALWGLGAISLFYPAEGGFMIVRYGVLAVLGIHVAEAWVFRKEIQAHAGNAAVGYLLVLIFGAVQMAQWRTVGRR